MKATAVIAMVLVLMAWRLDGAVSISVGDSSPDFALRTLDGDTVRLSDQENRVRVLFFFGCGPCGFSPKIGQEVEMNLYQPLQESGAHFFAIDGLNAGAASVATFAEESAISFPICLDGRELRLGYSSYRTDLIVIIDSAGIVASVIVFDFDYAMGVEQARREVEELLAGELSAVAGVLVPRYRETTALSERQYNLCGRRLCGPGAVSGWYTGRSGAPTPVIELRSLQNREARLSGTGTR